VSISEKAGYVEECRGWKSGVCGRDGRRIDRGGNRPQRPIVVSGSLMAGDDEDVEALVFEGCR